MTHRSTQRWIDVLAAVLQSYNNSYHRTIGMAPNEVNEQNEDEVARRMYPPKMKPVWKFRVRDTVRISRYKNRFAKGYLQG